MRELERQRNKQLLRKLNTPEVTGKGWLWFFAKTLFWAAVVWGAVILWLAS